MNRKTLVLPALAGVMTTVLTACGTQPGARTDGDTLVVGTTDTFEVSASTPAPFDPAAVYDTATWNVFRSTFQTLLRLPRSGTLPEPEAAEKCGFTDTRNTHYRCTLREGLTFSNGRDLTAADVVHSIRRVLDISDSHGPAALLSNIKAIETTPGNAVLFSLKKPDATFPHKLATPAAAIVDPGEYPGDALREGTEITGSGPYVVDEVKDGRIRLSANPRYQGGLKPRTKSVELRGYQDADQLEQALTRGEVDLVTRTLAPDQIERLRERDDVDLQETTSQSIRYLVFNTDAPAARTKAVRQAVAQLVDRQALVRDVYLRTAEPLHSIVPGGLPGHRAAFHTTYGEPDAKAARRLLDEAGVETPVKLTLAHTSDYYGPATRDEFKALAAQLNRSGLFRVSVTSAPWKEFRKAAVDGEYQVFGMGWSPDFPDADNFVDPFFGEDNFLDSPYRNAEITDRLIPRTRAAAERDQAEPQFVRIQEIVADEVPVLPLWQGKSHVAARSGVTGVEWALNSSSVLQLWELGRG
ncbi:peptide-binding protein [Streptomyces durbertensis]|uniref:Peptide-binding protein n=1 Tax=Streptomyces durbertensis TaxID=2448886 RepID=A0ABR6E9Z0_9ACTN|nr:ABC transporter substrate-binding protein [Streptomyces durbertensis]MBB1242157.1 peptide-binding protein [Streptomyces durbertensis]